MSESALALTFRCLLSSDADWLTDNANDPEVARYAISIYPMTEREVGESLKKDLEESSEKYIVAVLDGEAAGFVSLWFRPGAVRDRHVAWVGIAVRRKFWGRGVGTGLMREVVSLAGQSGFRKLMLGTIEGNERAIRLYGNLRFKTEAYEVNGVYVDGSWKTSFLMGLELAPCKPKLSRNSVVNAEGSEASGLGDICVRQAMNCDLDELHRLQNCSGSTKSTFRLPPITKEETKKWYEKLNSEEGRHCLITSKGSKLLGYLHFRAGRHPFPSLKSEEILVDVKQEPDRAARVLIDALKSYGERYWYPRIFAYAPETSLPLTEALADKGFKKYGAMKDYYFIDGYYVNSAVYAYP